MEKVAILNTSPDNSLPSGNAGPYGITPSLARPQRSQQHQIADQIREAADATGVPFEFLLAQASQESNLNPNARSSNSTATGLFQFTASTWLQMVYNHGTKHGLDEYARLISRNSQGELTVRDPAQLRDILELRKDPKASALMAGEYARENRQTLESRLGRSVSTHDLYLAHFLGAAGASRILGSAPDKSAADHLPDAAAANPTIFHDSNQEPRSVANLVKTVRRSFDRAHSTIMPVAQEFRPALDLTSLRPEPRPTEESADERLVASLTSVRQWLTFVEETALPTLENAITSNSQEFVALRPQARPETEAEKEWENLRQMVSMTSVRTWLDSVEEVALRGTTNTEENPFNPYDAEERLIAEAAADVVPDVAPLAVTAVEPDANPPHMPPVSPARVEGTVRLSFAMPPPLVSPLATASLAETNPEAGVASSAAVALTPPLTAEVETFLPSLRPFSSPVQGGARLVAPMPPPLSTAVAHADSSEDTPPPPTPDIPAKNS